MSPNLLPKIEGLLLGTAVADAIGLPTEGMSPRKIEQLGWAKNLKHRFVLGRGMWSDDTEQTIMLAQALIDSEDDLTKFTRSFTWELRWWILGMPAATGLATAKAIIKLWLGFPPAKSGVFSAGNGPAMRTAPIAAFFPDGPKKRKDFTEAQTRLTHTDPKALIGSLAITELAALLLNSEETPSTESVIATARGISSDSEWLDIISKIKQAHQEGKCPGELIASLGGNPQKGISGYVYQTVPSVILAGLRHDWNFEKTITELVTAGGDTDTTAAIAGALCGISRGPVGIPNSWIDQIGEWPTGVSDLRTLARHLHQKTPHRIRSHWSPFLLARNLGFLGIVLGHGLLRLLPRKCLK